MALSSANRCYDFPLAEPGQSKRRARFFLRGRTKTVRRRAGACAGRGEIWNACSLHIRTWMGGVFAAHKTELSSHTGDSLCSVLRLADIPPIHVRL